MAYSVKCPTSAGVMISWFLISSPALGSALTVWSLLGILALSSLSAPPVLLFSLSLKINKSISKQNKTKQKNTFPSEAAIHSSFPALACAPQLWIQYHPHTLLQMPGNFCALPDMRVCLALQSDCFSKRGTMSPALSVSRSLLCPEGSPLHVAGSFLGTPVAFPLAPGRGWAHSLSELGMQGS